MPWVGSGVGSRGVCVPMTTRSETLGGKPGGGGVSDP